MSSINTVNHDDNFKTMNTKMDKTFAEIDKINRLRTIMNIHDDHHEVVYDYTPLSESEIQYLKHVEEGKIEPLTLKERINFTNYMFEVNGIKVKRPKKKNLNPAGRPKGEGRGKSTRSKVKTDNLVNEVHVDNMPKSWAALFGK